jgi:hypothetical protein
MKVRHFVETTQERYAEALASYRDGLFGGHISEQTWDDDEGGQHRVMHNAGPDPMVPFPDRTVKWTLVAMCNWQRTHPEHTQYFILETVTLGVTHREVK